MRVLIIDRDLESSTLLSMIIELRGARATLAFSAMHAMAYLHRSPAPDLIILDMDLPDIDGLELLVQLKKSRLTRAIPIVITSAIEQPGLVAACGVLGAEAYFAKPIGVDVIDALLERQVFSLDRATRALFALAFAGAQQ